MHIAIITTYPPGKGTLNEYAYHFIRALRQKQEVERVTLLVDPLPNGASYPPAEAGTAAPMDIVPCWRFDSLTNALHIVQAVRKAKPDAVLFNIQFATFGGKKAAASLGLLAPKLVNLAGFPTFVLLHNIMETVDLKSAGYARQPWMEWIIRTAGDTVTRALLSVDRVMVTIPKYVEILVEKYHSDRVLLAPHGSFEEDLPQPSFDLPPGPKQLMTFGKFGTYKKVEMLLDALKLLEAEGRDDLEVVIAGSDSPNAAGYLAGVREAYGNKPNIIFTGYIAEEDVPRIFQDAAVVIFPYTSTTGSSGVLHQAGGYGKAVVLPNIGDFAEVISEEGYVGEFFQPDDPATLARAIARILESDDLRQQLGMRNYLAARGLPISDVVDWYLLHFESVIDQRNNPSDTRRAALPSEKGASEQREMTKLP